MTWPVRHGMRAGPPGDTGPWRQGTIGDDARIRAERQGEVEIFLGEARPATYQSLLLEAEALGVALRDLGLDAGDTVSFMVPNWMEAAAINLAAAIMGYVINPIVPIYREAETRFILRDCRSKVIFVPPVFRGHDHAEMIERIRADLPDLRHVVAVRGAAGDAIDYAALVEAGRGRRIDTPDVDPSGVKMVMYTSGTTGAPKGVLHSHQTLARAVDASAAFWSIQDGDVVLMPSPVTHVSGYSNGLERPFLGGTRTILMEEWSADAAVALIDRYAATMTVAATPFLTELTAAAERAGSTLASFRVFACGGAAVPPEVIHRADTVFARPCAFRVYGSSEAPFVTLGAAATDSRALAAETDGRAVDYDVRIVDDTGADVPEGEILVKGASLFLGYGRPDQTQESFTADGYFRTGDIGRVSAEGGLVITGRKKDLIIRGGENISAKEIEDALHTHPQIREAAVVAAPHARLGEGIFAFLIVEDDVAPDIAELRALLESQGLARQKCPEAIAVVDDLPRTASGKVRKDLLRARLASGGTA